MSHLPGWNEPPSWSGVAKTPAQKILTGDFHYPEELDVDEPYSFKKSLKVYFSHQLATCYRQLREFLPKLRGGSK